jgi:drug/metabolite transporter (DMT)-like permease
MSYGTGLLCILALVRGNVFNFDFSKAYIISLDYLSVFGSVIDFTAYFSLLKRIRAEQAAYATVLFPVVALTLSTLFENYQWTATAGFGVVITLLGNFLINWRST